MSSSLYRPHTCMWANSPCYSEKLAMCARCKKHAYCSSKDGQRSHWKAHKKECIPVDKLPKEDRKQLPLTWEQLEEFGTTTGATQQQQHKTAAQDRSSKSWKCVLSRPNRVFVWWRNARTVLEFANACQPMPTVARFQALNPAKSWFGRIHDSIT